MLAYIFLFACVCPWLLAALSMYFPNFRNKNEFEAILFGHTLCLEMLPSFVDFAKGSSRLIPEAEAFLGTHDLSSLSWFELHGSLPWNTRSGKK
jgi:hypothetical protein